MATGKKCKAIGIDLGTSYSCVAVWRNNHVEIIPNDNGKRTTPSCVAFTDTQRLIGDAAIKQLAQNPHNTIFDAKRLIGRRFSDELVQQDMKLWPFKVVPGTRDRPLIAVNYKGEEKKFAAEKISSMVLSKMKEVAEAYLGHEVTRAVITVPAYFNNSQRQATKDAGEIAGFDAVRIMNEPTAAAIAYALNKKERIKGKNNVMVFDLGGGTLDVSLVSIEDGTFEVKATVGDTHFGGVDFDNNLVNYIVDVFKRNHNKDISNNAIALRKLRLACMVAKRKLSSTSEAFIELDSLCEGINLHVPVTRDDFWLLNKDLFEKCVEAVVKCLVEAKIGTSEVHEVVLVGGSTRISWVLELLNHMFCDCEDGIVHGLCKDLNPDEAVAYGAAVRAAMLNGEVEDMLLMDVVPHNLGVEIDGGVMSVMVPINSMIPSKNERAFSISVNDQNCSYNLSYVHDTFGDCDRHCSIPNEQSSTILARIESISLDGSELRRRCRANWNSKSRNRYLIKVYEGEGSWTKENLFLGEIEVSGLSEINVCFAVDSNGIVKVTAEGKTMRLQGRLSLEEITRDAEWYKAEDEKKDTFEFSANDMNNRLKKLESYAYETSNSLKKLEKVLEVVLETIDM